MEMKIPSGAGTTHELQASSIPGRTSPDPSNIMPPPSTNNGSCNIYGCMVDVSKLTPRISSVRQQSSRSSPNTPFDNRCFNRKDSNSKINDFPSPVIPVPPSLND